MHKYGKKGYSLRRLELQAPASVLEPRGYSLLELMVTVSAFSLLTIAAAGVFDSAQEALNWNYHELTLQSDLRKTLDIMSEELRESSPSSPIPLTVNSNSISFEIPATVQGGVITGWTSVSYGLGPDSTVLRTVNGQAAAIGHSVSALDFIYPVDPVTAPRTVQVRITGQRATLKRTLTHSAVTQIILRNP